MESASTITNLSGPAPFAQVWVSITRQEQIEVTCRLHYLEAQNQILKNKLEQALQETIRQKAKNKDLQNRLFGRKSEKASSKKSEKSGSADNDSVIKPKRKRGQQNGSQGHGRTARPDLPVVLEERDLSDEQKTCTNCRRPYQRKEALDERSSIIEVKVKAYTRTIQRLAYTPACECEHTPAILMAPPVPRVSPCRSFGTSFWVEVILNKYRYAQPSNRYLSDLNDQGLPVSPGTLAGGLKKLMPLFNPVMDALYVKQMSEDLFHNDETRWEVFVKMEGKVGTRWYLWVTRSSSVVYYCIDPSRSAAVPGAHFAGLQNDSVVIVCDRYSAYKKLARLSDAILLAFCWAHVRRDFLNAGLSFKTLENWALLWKKTIGLLYHLNKLRLKAWDEKQSLDAQSVDFKQYHQKLEAHLQTMHDKAEQAVTRVRDDNVIAGRQQNSLVGVKGSAQKQQVKVYRSLLNHWDGLTLFMRYPQVPLDNNIAENSIRGPVTGRKGYYGSGSIWSAELAAMLFAILQTLDLWGINPRHWLSCYLNACADSGGQAPQDIQSFIPWQMDDAQRDKLSRPQPP
jgi:transposase